MPLVSIDVLSPMQFPFFKLPFPFALCAAPPPSVPVAGSSLIWTDFSADYAWRSNTQPHQIKAPAVAEWVSEWVESAAVTLRLLRCVCVCALLTHCVRQVLNDCSGHPSNEGFRFTPVSSFECSLWLVGTVFVQDLHATRLWLLPSRTLFSKQPVWMAVT